MAAGDICLHYISMLGLGCASCTACSRCCCAASCKAATLLLGCALPVGGPTKVATRLAARQLEPAGCISTSVYGVEKQQPPPAHASPFKSCPPCCCLTSHNTFVPNHITLLQHFHNTTGDPLPAALWRGGPRPGQSQQGRPAGHKCFWSTRGSR